MYTASKKTKAINCFKRSAVNNVRDLYAKYGNRFNTKAVFGSDGKSSADVTPQGSAVIDQMISGQNIIKRHSSPPDDLPQ